MKRITKVLWIDTETTGTDHGRHEIHELAMLMELDGKVVGELLVHMRPLNWDTVEDEALAVSGKTRDELKGYPEPHSVYLQVGKFLSQFVDKFDKGDKVYPGGYNVRFDTDFIRAFFERSGDKYWGSWSNHREQDSLPLVRILNRYGLLDLPDLKLGTVCKAYGVPLDENAHSALHDVKAARELYYKLLRKVGNGIMLLPPRNGTPKEER